MGDAPVSVKTGGRTAQVNMPAPEHRGPPAWTLGAVWYQVFPERFRNADAANDPTGPGVIAMPWNANWDEVTIEQIERVRAHRLATGRGAGSAQTWTSRRYGGDLAGVVEKLDHVEDLGALLLLSTERQQVADDLGRAVAGGDDRRDVL